MALPRHSEPPPPAQAKFVFADKFIPLALARFPGPFPSLRALPSSTPTRTSTPRPSPTSTARPTAGPSPTATRPGGPVNYPTDPETIIIQIGWSDTDQPGLTWEEMNGTPYLTLYGDGRLIAGHTLFDWQQSLFEGRVEADQIQAWLQELTYDIGFFTLDTHYEHPDYTKFTLHEYVRYGSAARDFKRVSITGFTRWLRDPLPDVPKADVVRRAALFAKDLEALATATLDKPYYADQYTALSMEVNPILPSPPRWSHSLDVVAISDSAPIRYGGGFVHGPPGHRTVDGALGLELWGIVSVDARRNSPGLNQAAEYAVRGRRFVVGVRQEVPGESLFLPTGLRMEWYRKDGGAQAHLPP